MLPDLGLILFLRWKQLYALCTMTQLIIVNWETMSLFPKYEALIGFRFSIIMWWATNLLHNLSTYKDNQGYSTVFKVCRNFQLKVYAWTPAVTIQDLQTNSLKGWIKTWYDVCVIIFILVSRINEKQLIHMLKWFCEIVDKSVPTVK